VPPAAAPGVQEPVPDLRGVRHRRGGGARDGDRAAHGREARRHPLPPRSRRLLPCRHSPCASSSSPWPPDTGGDAASDSESRYDVRTTLSIEFVMTVINHKAASVPAVPMWPSWSSELAHASLAPLVGHCPLLPRWCAVSPGWLVFSCLLACGLPALFLSLMKRSLLKLRRPFYSVSGFVSRLGGRNHVHVILSRDGCLRLFARAGRVISLLDQAQCAT
jgi:hypothetical protein